MTNTDSSRPRRLTRREEHEAWLIKRWGPLGPAWLDDLRSHVNQCFPLPIRWQTHRRERRTGVARTPRLAVQVELEPWRYPYVYSAARIDIRPRHYRTGSFPGGFDLGVLAEPDVDVVGRPHDPRVSEAIPWLRALNVRLGGLLAAHLAPDLPPWDHLFPEAGTAPYLAECQACHLRRSDDATHLHRLHAS